MRRRAIFLGLCVAATACIPAGNAPSDAGPAAKTAGFRPSTGVMTAPFSDAFERPAATDGGSPPRPPNDLGPDWSSTAAPGVWRVEGGRLCGEHARNHGVWLNRVLPVNARIEFEAVSYSNDGDLKAELWGDGRSSATGESYSNASSYLTIFGGWQNSMHVLARIDEHGKDRKHVQATAGGIGREKNVTSGRTYKFKVERTDGQTVRWLVDGAEIHTFTDHEPLAGMGHDHFGFNDWDAKVCFDNVKVTPL